jgi:ABC-type transporter Mla subunit MlaD
MDRRTVVLGIAAAVAVCAAVAVTVFGRSSASPKHKAVAAYITDVDQIQQGMQVQLINTVSAFRALANGSVGAKTLTPRLAQAESTLRVLQGRLVALPAPAPAKRLRLLLIRLTSSEASTAHEVGQLARFSPRFAALLKDVRTAGTELARAIGAVKPPKSHKLHGTKKQIQQAQAAFTAAADKAAGLQADAVDSYVAKIARLERELRKLNPPPIVSPDYRTQLRTLTASRTTGSALAKELRKTNRSDVASFSRRFTLAARIAGSVSAQKAQIAAIKAYNQRVRKIGALQGDIKVELTRLQQEVG